MDREFQHAIDFARERLLADGFLTPMFHGFGTSPVSGQRASIIIATPFVGKTFEEVERSKHAAAEMVRLTFAVHNISKYTFISEAWVKRFDNEDEFSSNPRSLEHEPGRLEVLVCYCVDREKKEARTYEMLRGPEGKLTGYRDVPFAEGGELSGRMVSLLPPADSYGKVPSAYRVLAEEILRRYGVPDPGFRDKS